MVLNDTGSSIVSDSFKIKSLKNIKTTVEEYKGENPLFKFLVESPLLIP